MALYLPNKTLITADNRGTFPEKASAQEFAFLMGLDYVLGRLNLATTLYYLRKTEEGCLEVFVDDPLGNIGAVVTRDDNPAMLSQNNLQYLNCSRPLDSEIPLDLLDKRRISSIYRFQRLDDPSYKAALYVPGQRPTRKEHYEPPNFKPGYRA